LPNSLLTTRRTLLKQAATLAVSLGLLGQNRPQRKGMAPELNAMELEPFVDPLFVPPILKSTAMRPNPSTDAGKAHFYELTMREIHSRMHRDLPSTRLWSYGPEAIGPTIEAHQNEDILVEWKNSLPQRHFLPIDYTLHGSGRDVPESRAAVHVHGGRNPTDGDGYPEDWYATGKSRVSHYRNRQSAATLWYHDHAMGVTRLNVYAGLMGMYLLRDDQEKSLNLPSGPYELPLMLCDRSFDRDGQLFYPVSTDPAHPWVDDVAGDAMVVNGRVQPFREVEPRRYRLRIVNCSNGRFFRLSLSNDRPFHQIGADQGFLAAPVQLSVLLIAPGERADLIVDFAPHAGARVVLKSGPLAFLQFRVGSGSTKDDSTMPVRLAAIPPAAADAALRTRVMTLDQYDEPNGRAMVMLLNRTPWHRPATEIAQVNTSEIWSLVNLTDETHPIHLHHVRFRVLDRRAFDRDRFLLAAGDLRYAGDALACRANETGWKDVVQCPPGTVTRILIQFDGMEGRYVWHCHVLEHEANDMMRPFEIKA
jgi:spore coat protein A, manganese oxidase